MKELTNNEAFNLTAPFPYTLITSLDKEGKPNILGVSWITRTSWSPFLVMISIDHSRYSHEGIEVNKEFVLHYPTEKQVKEAWKCGITSGRKIDKIQEIGLNLIQSKNIKTPTIEGCTVAFECKVVSSFVTGDHTVFVGEVVNATGTDGENTRLFATADYKIISIDSKGNSNTELEI